MVWAKRLWVSYPMRVFREAGLVLDLAWIGGSGFIGTAAVAVVNLWTDIGVVAQVMFGFSVSCLVLAVVVAMYQRLWQRPRKGWRPHSRLQMDTDQFGHGLLMTIKGPETLTGIECRISGPRGIRLRNLEPLWKAAMNEATIHFPGEFKPKLEPFPPPGKYIVRWSALVTRQDERHPYNEERIPLGRETFRVDQFGSIKTKKRDLDFG